MMCVWLVVVVIMRELLTPLFQKFGHFKLHEFGAWTCRVGPSEGNDTSTGSVACSSESTGAL